MRDIFRRSGLDPRQLTRSFLDFVASGELDKTSLGSSELRMMDVMIDQMSPEDMKKALKIMTRQVASSQREIDQMTVDELTQVTDRRSFLKYLSTELHSGNIGSGSGHKLVFIDLDGFKDVNDSCGHDIGDEVLRELAERLKSRIGSYGLLARLGGDEFVLLTEGNLDRDSIKSEIRASIQGLIKYDNLGNGHPIGASIGISDINPSDAITESNVGQQIIDILSDADKAMYADKQEKPARMAALREGVQGSKVIIETSHQPS